jgi:hypothetical protein
MQTPWHRETEINQNQWAIVPCSRPLWHPAKCTVTISSAINLIDIPRCLSSRALATEHVDNLQQKAFFDSDQSLIY